MQAASTRNIALRKRRQFLLFAVLFYLLFALVALGWSRIRGPGEILSFNSQRPYPLLETGIIAAAFLLNLFFDLFAHRLLPSARSLFESLGEALGKIGVAEAALLAASSAAGEELLFRGVIQPKLGLIAASLLFALSHFPVRKELILWPFYALTMGLVLGALRQLGGDIWSAVLLHFLVNFFGLLYISRRFSRRGAARPEQKPPPRYR